MADSDPNVGEGTPISPGSPGSGTFAEPLPYTLLSLPRFAKILGINPVHFQGATGSDVFYLKGNACSDVWPQYSWQNSDAVSRQDLAHTIESVEHDIARVLGYHPAPRWISNEFHRFPSFYRPDLTTSSGRQFETGLLKTVKSGWKKFIEGGARTADLIGTATTSGGSLQYLDIDGDGFAETARITLAYVTTSDAREIKVYQTGMNADQRWEIRPPKSITFSGGNVVIDMDSWLFVNPDAQAAHPSTDGFSAVDVTTTANYVISVDVYREYTDDTGVSVQFFWEPGTAAVCNGCALQQESGDFILLEEGGELLAACPTCGLIVQNGCIMVRDFDNGILAPSPAVYDPDSQTQIIQSYAVSREPDSVRFWYRAGETDEYYERRTGYDPLSEYWAQSIAYMAVARLERPFCSCANVTSLAKRWQTDFAFSGGDSAFNIDFKMLANPFGTRAGEVFAWNRVSKLGKIIYDGVVI